MASKHTAHVTHSLKTPELPYYAACSCGQNSGWVETEQVAESWLLGHLRNIERVRLALTRRPAGVADQYEWYVKQSERSDIPEREREMWLLLAEGLENRLGDNTIQGELF